MVLRPVVASDEPALVEIFNDPTVVQWWGDADESLTDTLEPDEDVMCFMIEVDGEPAGMIQASEETGPMYRHAGIDIALLPKWQGKGIGPDAVRTLARHLIDERGHHRLTIDPAATNHGAIRCYQKAGFRPVGVLREYERGPDGTFHDGLLMDLLRGELIQPPGKKRKPPGVLSRTV